MFDWSQCIIYAAIILISLAAAISLASLLRFPSILVKLLVLEVSTNLLMAIIAIWALMYNQPLFIDICLPLALIMFLGVLAYYQFLLNREESNASDHW